MTGFHGNIRTARSIGGVQVCQSLYNPNTFLPRHDHARAFWCLTLAGGYTEHIGRRCREAGRDHLAWHPPGEHHQLRFGSGECAVINIELDDDWLDRAAEEGLQLDQPRDLGEQGVALVSALLTECACADSGAHFVIESLLADLLAETAVFGELPPWRDTPAWLQNARDYLRIHYHEPVRLGEVAEAVGIHPIHLARSFRQLTGRPIGAFLRQLRVDTARTLLRTTDRPLADVAVTCGFSDQPHFCRVFRRLTGTTPARYRSPAAPR